MKYLILTVLSFVALSLDAQDETTQTISTPYTLEKEITGVDKEDIKWSEVYDIAIINIKDCQTEEQKIATIKSYLSIFPFIWRLKFLYYCDRYYPQYRWTIRH